MDRYKTAPRLDHGSQLAPQQRRNRLTASPLSLSISEVMLPWGFAALQEVNSLINFSLSRRLHVNI